MELNDCGQRQKTNRFLYTNPKNNLGPLRASIAYKIVSATAGISPMTGSEIQTSKIVWEETVEVTAEEALAASAAKQESADATTFLMDLLADGPRSVKYIEERAAGRRGLSERQLARAKTKMGVVAFKEKGKVDGAWFWALPQHAPVEGCQT
jgi:hypothetical protein